VFSKFSRCQPFSKWLTLTNLNCLLQESAGFANTSFLFCGDWNVVQNKSDDTCNVIHDRNQNARKKIEELKETFELLDPWPTCYPVGKTKNNGRVVSSIAWNYFGILHERKNIF
jgi:hypothetical protein